MVYSNRTTNAKNTTWTSVEDLRLVISAKVRIIIHLCKGETFFYRILEEKSAKNTTDCLGLFTYRKKGTDWFDLFTYRKKNGLVRFIERIGF